MKHLPHALLIIASLLLVANAAQAQTLYFDPSHSGTASGGSGEFNGTDNFENSGTNQTFTSGADAVFDGAAGTVTVDAPVSADSLEVGVTSGTEEIGTSGADASTITFPATQYHTVIQADAGTENVVFNSAINENITAPNYNDSFSQSYTSGNITFNGGISFTNNSGDGGSGNGTGEPGLVLYANTAGGTYTINSAVTNSGVGGNEPAVSYSGTNAGNSLTLTKAASFSGVYMQADAGSTVLDQGASYTNNAFISDYGSYLTDAAGVNVSATIQNNGGTLTVGGALAADTTFSGNITAYQGGTPTLTSAAGGVVHFTGNIGNNSGGGEIIKTGAGVVSMENPNETFYGTTDIQNGTLLANNFTTTPGASISGATVMIENIAPSSVTAAQTVATLGGNGEVSANVVAVGANSVITPGSVTGAGVQSIGTLTLAGGLSAENGVTLDFTLDGAAANGYSTINLAGSALQLNGTMTFNFTNIGSTPLSLDTAYNIVTGIEFKNSDVFTDPDNDNDYIVNAPAGYTVDLMYPTYTANASNQGYLTVEFEAAPEPSTYAMMLGGLALLGFCVRRKLA